MQPSEIEDHDDGSLADGHRLGITVDQIGRGLTSLRAAMAIMIAVGILGTHVSSCIQSHMEALRLQGLGI